MFQNKITVVAFHVVCEDGTPLVLGVEEVQAKFPLNIIAFEHGFTVSTHRGGW